MNQLMLEKFLEIKKLKSISDELNKKINDLAIQSNALQEEIAPINENIEKLKAELLTLMKEANTRELVLEDNDPSAVLYAGIFKRVTKNFDEVNALNVLKTYGLTSLINVKETIKKKDLNKELKNNINLKESLLPYTSDKITEYIVVTDAENYRLMLEHMIKEKE